MCCCVMVFSICAPVLTKSAAKMTFSLGYVLNVAFIALCHINEIRRRAGDVMSYTSLFVGSETSLRHGSLCNERTRFAPFSVTTGKLPEPRRGGGRSEEGRGGSGWGLSAVFGLHQYGLNVISAIDLVSTQDAQSKKPSHNDTLINHYSLPDLITKTRTIIPFTKTTLNHLGFWRTRYWPFLFPKQ